ncbi:M15 family metallopeptidase [Paenibacillus cremeus]|uniref:D-alanyl-D-alanine carboxypeptidase family protein n=1 Tax=Paenibacillus cremeus TaxID=2163881 RepID=A0A559JPY1_9BACL|nr:M15 family metallopeptidase [Paenibacillus cremeus]TVY01920.1 D-alanyl-D-alanine carboxypeptidase family protein [Paenibacillus cremeus]
MRPYHRMYTFTAAALLSGALLLAAGCDNGKTASQPPAASPETAKPSSSPDAGKPATTSPGPAAGGASTTPAGGSASSAAASPPPNAPAGGASAVSGSTGSGAIQVVANPTDRAVLVNKQFKLPDHYNPSDLVEPNVAFTFKEHLEKRKMRKEAAGALEKLFAGAKADGLPLVGVSAYRSYETQTTVYKNYVKQDGEEAANKYSAKPGQSEHQTGLAIDVSGSNGKCAAEDCFGETKEAKWLEQHAPEYGFIIRYPKGKEDITGYQYEPWHLRYVGTEMAKDIAKKNVTLEEYLGSSVPVAKPTK